MEEARLRKICRVLGERVRELRKAKGFTQEDFAFECGLSRNYMGSVERGERNISVANIANIADVLGITASELLSGIK